MSPRHRTARTVVATAAPAKAPEALVLQFHFDAPPPARAKEARKSSERASSIKDAIVRWLDEQL